MALAQFYHFSENVGMYIDKEITYKTYVPSRDSYAKRVGKLCGIGQGTNKECLIIYWYGYRSAIHYSQVKFPKC